MMHSSEQVDQIHLKFGQKSLKTLIMLYCEDCEFSLNGVVLVVQQISEFIHEKRNCCNSTPDRQIFSKFHVLDESWPEDIFRPILNHIHSPTDWQQEMILSSDVLLAGQIW